MGWCTPACTELACKWNQATKKEIIPKRISDIIVRKNLGTNLGTNLEKVTNREEKRMKDLNEFDPRIQLHRTRESNDTLTSLYKRIEEAEPEASILQSLETDDDTDSNINKHSIENIIHRTFNANKYNSSDQELVNSFLQNLHITEQDIKNIEQATLAQSDNPLWFELRKGRLTASKHHDIYTKINTLTKATGDIKPKTTPLVARILFSSNKTQNVEAMKWGVDNEKNAFKSFYASEIEKHTEFKTEKAGLFISKQRPYIAASPDGLLLCKCHGKSTIEIKCPYKIRYIKNIKNAVTECDFLTLVNGELSIKKSHKYYTQIQSQMAIASTMQSYFVVWTTNDMFVQKIDFDKEHWMKVSINLEVFFKTYICPALLEMKPVIFCGNCEKFCLEENEINPNEQNEMNSIQCDKCGCWFHGRCENIQICDIVQINEWLCSNCLMSMSNQ